VQYTLGVTKSGQAGATNTDLPVANTWFRGADQMTTVLHESDPRGAKAVAIATAAGQWLKCHTRDGRKAYGIPSSRNDGRYYLTTRTSCDCFDAQRHECKHQLAVRLHCELVAERRAESAAAEAVYSDMLAHPETVVETYDIFKRFEGD
jgi:hypothetical protein